MNETVVVAPGFMGGAIFGESKSYPGTSPSLTVTGANGVTPVSVSGRSSVTIPFWPSSVETGNPIASLTSPLSGSSTFFSTIIVVDRWRLVMVTVEVAPEVTNTLGGLTLIRS